MPADIKAGAVTAAGKDGPEHMQNWLECVRSRKQPNADVVTSHYLAAACYLSTASYFSKQPAYWQDTWDL